MREDASDGRVWTEMGEKKKVLTCSHGCDYRLQEGLAATLTDFDAMAHGPPQ